MILTAVNVAALARANISCKTQTRLLAIESSPREETGHCLTVTKIVFWDPDAT
jgi:hypothetical protein